MLANLAQMNRVREVELDEIETILSDLIQKFQTGLLGDIFSEAFAESKEDALAMLADLAEKHAARAMAYIEKRAKKVAIKR